MKTIRYFVEFWYAVFWLTYDDAKCGNIGVRKRKDRMVERLLVQLYREGRLFRDEGGRYETNKA